MFVLKKFQTLIKKIINYGHSLKNKEVFNEKLKEIKLQNFPKKVLKIFASKLIYFILVNPYKLFISSDGINKNDFTLHHKRCCKGKY